MDKTVAMKVVEALNELNKEVPDKVVGEPLVHLNEPVHFSILCELHHVVTDRPLPLEHPGFFFFLLLFRTILDVIRLHMKES